MSRGGHREQRRAKLALAVDDDYPPVVEAALPKLAEVDVQAYLIVGDLHDITRHNLVPCKHGIVHGGEVGGSRDSHKNCIFALIELILSYSQVDLKVLSNGADNRAEGTLHLPVHAVVKHVEEDHGLITHKDVLVAE